MLTFPKVQKAYDFSPLLSQSYAVGKERLNYIEGNSQDRSQGLRKESDFLRMQRVQLGLTPNSACILTDVPNSRASPGGSLGKRPV